MAPQRRVREGGDVPAENPPWGESGAPEGEDVADDEVFIRKTMDSHPILGVELLYRRYFQPLCSHAVRYVGARAVAEDLVSEVFCQFYSGQVFQTISTSYRVYLYRTVRNRAFNYLKRELRRAESLEVAREVSLPEEQQPDTISQYEELYQDVDRAINTLPVERRRIFILRRFEGKRYQEIAAELGLSVKTVEVQIYRANRQILALLRAKWLPAVLTGTVGWLLLS
jgi:RNA polymerase sigma-70 factor (family 1)